MSDLPPPELAALYALEREAPGAPPSARAALRTRVLVTAGVVAASSAAAATTASAASTGSAVSAAGAGAVATTSAAVTTGAAVTTTATATGILATTTGKVVALVIALGAAGGGTAVVASRTHDRQVVASEQRAPARGADVEVSSTAKRDRRAGEALGTAAPSVETPTPASEGSAVDAPDPRVSDVRTAASSASAVSAADAPKAPVVPPAAKSRAKTVAALVASPPPPNAVAEPGEASPPPHREEQQHEWMSQALLLADAWTALRAGDARLCLALVTRDAREHAASPMAEERDALRVLAVRALGNRAGARSLADAFFATYPTSVHRAAIEKALP